MPALWAWPCGAFYTTTNEMINLLPEGEKQAILKRRRLKLFLIFETAVLLFLVSSALAFLSIRIYLAGEIDIQRGVIAQRKNEVGIQAITDFQKQITDLNLKFKNVKSFYQRQVDLAEVLQKISTILPCFFYFTSLSFIQDPVAPRINIVGFSRTRDALLLFKRDLESGSDFQKVNFPPTTWVSPANIDFSLNLEVKR